MSRKYSSADPHQMARAAYDEETESFRMTVVSGKLPEFKVESTDPVSVPVTAPVVIETRIERIEIPVIVKEYEKIEVPIIIKETEVKIIEIEKPLVHTEYKIVEVEKPIIVPRLEIKEVPTIIIQTVKEFKLTQKAQVLLVLQTILNLVLGYLVLK